MQNNRGGEGSAPGSAYLTALRMLVRRDLSEAQVRERLARHVHDLGAIDEAVARLKMEGAIDDRRVADAIVRRAASVKHQSRHRVMRELESLGIASATAARGLDDVVSDIDDTVLIEAAVTRRLRGRVAIADEAEFRRLYRYLVAQGFEVDAIVRALEKKR